MSSLFMVSVLLAALAAATAAPDQPACIGPACAASTKCWHEEGGTKPCWDGDGAGIGNASTTQLTFGTGLSGGGFGPVEKTLFAHQIGAGHTGVMNHFWSTCNAECEGALMVRYYIDGEENASIAFEPGMAAGTGFDDPAAPWGTKWMGHGAHSAWFHNFKIPFGSSIRVTIQSTDATQHGGFYIIVRGGLDIPLVIGDVVLPDTARLQLQKFAGRLETNEVLDMVSVPKGHAGLVFLNTLAVNNSGHGVTFLEGCPHMFDPPDQAWPGVLLGSGTEDYFDSGWYFNAGEFRLPVAGETHNVQNEKVSEWSAYRFHEMDPLRFQDGVRVTWRCGEAGGSAPDGSDKCYAPLPPQPPPHNDRTLCEYVQSYGWVYVWPAADSKVSDMSNSSFALLPRVCLSCLLRPLSTFYCPPSSFPLCVVWLGVCAAATVHTHKPACTRTRTRTCTCVPSFNSLPPPDRDRATPLPSPLGRPPKRRGAPGLFAGRLNTRQSTRIFLASRVTIASPPATR